MKRKKEHEKEEKKSDSEMEKEIIADILEKEDTAGPSPRSGEGEGEASVKENKSGEEKEDYLAHLQRLQAEFENFRKRTDREKQMIRQYVLEEFVADLLPVLDNFHRAMDSFSQAEEAPFAFVEGVKMILDQFLDIFKRYGVREIKSVGEKFDPLLHEAVGAEESDKEDGMIIKEIQKGYVINDRVIRPAAVIVSQTGTNFESDASHQEGIASDE